MRIVACCGAAMVRLGQMTADGDIVLPHNSGTVITHNKIVGKCLAAENPSMPMLSGAMSPAPGHGQSAFGFCVLSTSTSLTEY
jgi:hypothetical protein